MRVPNVPISKNLGNGKKKHYKTHGSVKKRIPLTLRWKKKHVVSQHFFPTESPPHRRIAWHLLTCHIQWAGRHRRDANAQLSRARRRHLWQDQVVDLVMLQNFMIHNQ